MPRSVNAKTYFKYVTLFRSVRLIYWQRTDDYNFWLGNELMTFSTCNIGWDLILNVNVPCTIISRSWLKWLRCKISGGNKEPKDDLHESQVQNDNVNDVNHAQNALMALKVICYSVFLSHSNVRVSAITGDDIANQLTSMSSSVSIDSALNTTFRISIRFPL